MRVARITTVLLLIAAFMFALGVALPVLAQVPGTEPLEQYVTSAPTALFPYASGLLLPVIPNGNPGSMQSVSINSLLSHASGGGTPGGAVGNLQINLGTTFGGLAISPSFTTANGIFDLAPGAVCRSVGAWSGDLSGASCAPVLSPGAASRNVGSLTGDLAGTLPSPTLSVGAASRNVGNLTGDLSGTLLSPVLSPGAASRNVGALGGGLSGGLPNPTLNPAAVSTALGRPGGDVGGTSFGTMLVTGLQGFPISSTPPTTNSALVWNGSSYAPAAISPGITQIQGDITAGPGTGLQTATINPGAVSNTKLASASPMTVKCNGGTQAASPQDCPVTGGLSLTNGGLQLSPNLGFSGLQTVGSTCWTLQNGIILTVTTSACSSGIILTADDGSTQLTADDGATILTSEMGNPPTPCATNMVLKFNIACNAVASPQVGLFRAL